MRSHQTLRIVFDGQRRNGRPSRSDEAKPGWESHRRRAAPSVHGVDDRRSRMVDDQDDALGLACEQREVQRRCKVVHHARRAEKLLPTTCAASSRPRPAPPAPAATASAWPGKRSIDPNPGPSEIARVRTRSRSVATRPQRRSCRWTPARLYGPRAEHLEDAKFVAGMGAEVMAMRGWLGDLI